MANGGYWESEAAWRRVEAPLIDIDEVIGPFSSIHGLPVTRNVKDWPERSIRWGTGIERLIQFCLADEAALTFNLWLCAWQDRGAERYWKHETPACYIGRLGRGSVKRVAVFGNTGGGKSTFARRLAELTHIPLYPLDMIQYRAGGGKVPHHEYLKAHAELLQRDAWIIDGYGCRESSWERFACADSLVYIDLPLFTHFRWVTKRLFKGFLATPEGWPEGSPMLSSTVSSYRVLWLCHRHLTPRYRELVSAARQHKRVHHLRSPAEMEAFLLEVRPEAQRA